MRGLATWYVWNANYLLQWTCAKCYVDVPLTINLDIFNDLSVKVFFDRNE